MILIGHRGAGLHVFTSSRLHVFTSSRLHVFTSSRLHWNRAGFVTTRPERVRTGDAGADALIGLTSDGVFRGCTRS